MHVQCSLPCRDFCSLDPSRLHDWYNFAEKWSSPTLKHPCILAMLTSPRPANRIRSLYSHLNRESTHVNHISGNSYLEKSINSIGPKRTSQTSLRHAIYDSMFPTRLSRYVSDPFTTPQQYRSKERKILSSILKLTNRFERNLSMVNSVHHSIHAKY